MNKELKIREAKASDALFLTSISFGSKRYWNYPESYFKIWHDDLTITEQYIKDNDVFVAEKNEAIIAYCSIRKDEETGYWLDHLFVRPAYIRNGIGSALIEELISFCKGRHIKSIKLLSDSNPKGFYEKIGARFIKEVESNIPNRMLGLYVLPIQTNKKIEEAAAARRTSNNTLQYTKEGIKADRGLFEKKLYELDKDMDEEEREEEDDEASIANFKFTTPIGYKFQCEEEAAKAGEEIAASEESAVYELSQDEITVREKEDRDKDQEMQQAVEQILHRVTEEEREQRKKIKQLAEVEEENTLAEETNTDIIKTEKEKMLQGEEYIAWGNEIADDKKHAENLLRELNFTDRENRKQIRTILNKLLGSSGEYIQIEPDFKCQYGYNIHVGENLCIGYNCVILDQAKVTIGDNCIISPQVGIYTAAYPINAGRRIAGYEYARPITIGDNVWVGGGSIIKPGVTIGDNVVIEPGSVVDSDIKSNMIAGGNPAKVIKEIDE